jgi:DtxR family transcriptional regulator, Mn-dependent transcriptional regulator
VRGSCNEGDEILERLWSMKEAGRDTVAELRTMRGEQFDPADLDDLVKGGLALQDGGRVGLTPTGAARAEKLIRAHRLGERLIHDVLGKEFESGACEFEHIVDTGIVDGICTLLGHPRECPHGFLIPEGECCRKSATVASRIIAPLTEMEIGQSARIAYVYARSDRQMHRLASLRIAPGESVKLHQKQPAFVIECEGASIALDGEIAAGINVWIGGETTRHTRPSSVKPRWKLRGGREAR